ncbi:hypothetical protein GCM10022256_01080 [Frondihabitans peucedani]|uniref:Uncharacterized protein n=1 Tax=Frondihabitans peucedani TaxID=598626 RepID=A0ABP8DWX3_9MICO
MDPLLIAGRVRKRLDALLVDLDPPRRAELRADDGASVVLGLEECGGRGEDDGAAGHDSGPPAT